MAIGYNGRHDDLFYYIIIAIEAGVSSQLYDDNKAANSKAIMAARWVAELSNCLDESKAFVRALICR